MPLANIAMTGKIKGILIAVAGTALAGILAALWYQTSRLNSAQEENGRLTVRLEQAVEANETNQETIHALEEANAELLERIRLDAVAAEKAARDARERAAELRRQREKAGRELDRALSSTPSCEELGRLDLAAACPALGGRLLSLYSRNRPDGDGGGGGPGPDPSP